MRCNICAKHMTYKDLTSGLTIQDRLDCGSRYDDKLINLNMCRDCYNTMITLTIMNCTLTPIIKED